MMHETKFHLLISVSKLKVIKKKVLSDITIN